MMDGLKKLLKSYKLSDQLVEHILSCGTMIEVKSLDSLVALGSISENMFYVKKGGLISQYFDEKSERERTTNFYLPDFQPFFVVSECYFEGLPSMCQIKAFTKSEVICYNKEDIMKLIEISNQYRSFYYKNIIEALVSKEKLTSKLITLNSNILYSTLIKEYPEIIKKVPSKYIAEFMGVTPQWLSKIKKTDF
ncbi:Crp/Fnr family transcriptional regulator [Chryseobacterium sp. 22532]|jgi:hypothetical protein|uniref:Crp/Fnr family transcriptional regulator n=1 Tax=Chryseobacterium sp. 22532 TaxID=3453938 RepID=UPI003F833539